MRKKFKHKLSEATSKEESSANPHLNIINLNRPEQIIDADKNAIDHFSLAEDERRDVFFKADSE